jgi:hypothetical protein
LGLLAAILIGVGVGMALTRWRARSGLAVENGA